MRPCSFTPSLKDANLSHPQILQRDLNARFVTCRDVLDFSLDNKWVAEGGRLNPLTFALSPVVGTHSNPALRRSGALDRKASLRNPTFTSTQISEAKRNPKVFMEKVVDAHAEYQETITSNLTHQAFSLMLYDVLCTGMRVILLRVCLLLLTSEINNTL